MRKGGSDFWHPNIFIELYCPAHKSIADCAIYKCTIHSFIHPSLCTIEFFQSLSPLLLITKVHVNIMCNDTLVIPSLVAIMLATN